MSPHDPHADLFDRHPHGVVRLQSVRSGHPDTEYVCIYANDAARRLLGATELVGERIPAALDRTEVLEALARTESTGDPAELLVDGLSLIAVRTREALVLFLQPEPPSLRACNAELERRTEEFATLLDLLPVGVWWSDKDCERIVGNRAAYEMLGLPHGINASLSASEDRLTLARCVIDGRELEPDELPMQRAARTGTVVRNCEHDVVRWDGVTRTVYANVAPLLDRHGQVRSVVGVYVDITDLKRLERERQELLARVDALVANAPIAIAAFDDRLRWVAINDEAARMEGVPRELHLGRTPTELRSALGREVEPLLRRVRDTGRPISGVELSLPSDDGASRHWIANFYPIRGARDGAVGVGAAALEITDRKRARSSSASSCATARSRRTSRTATGGTCGSTPSSSGRSAGRSRSGPGGWTPTSSRPRRSTGSARTSSRSSSAGRAPASSRP